MALLDIMDEISGRQSQRSEMGDAGIPGVMLGVVVENYNKDMPGQVRVRIPVRDSDADMLKWAKVARPYSGKGWGAYFHPEKEDQVLLAFERGNMDAPFVIAAVQRDSDTVIQKASDESNQTKELVMKNGSRIVFTDHKDGGEKDKIQILTANDFCRFILDNEGKTITLEDKEKNCSLMMNLKDGELKVNTAKKLTLSVGKSAEISINGDSGTVEIKADILKLNAGKSLELKTNGSLKMSGQQSTLEASTMLKASSGGMVTIAGSPIKMG